MLKMFKGVTNVYGNNTVYVTDGEHGVQKLENQNYEVKSLQDDGDELWITSGVIVAIGACCEPPLAIEQLESVLKRMEDDARLSGRGGKSLRSGKSRKRNTYGVRAKKVIQYG